MIDKQDILTAGAELINYFFTPIARLCNKLDNNPDLERMIGFIVFNLVIWTYSILLIQECMNG